MPESLISKVIEEDSEESSEGIDDGNWFDDNNGDIAKIVSMYKNQEWNMWSQNSSAIGMKKYWKPCTTVRWNCAIYSQSNS